MRNAMPSARQHNEAPDASGASAMMAPALPGKIDDEQAPDTAGGYSAEPSEDELTAYQTFVLTTLQKITRPEVMSAIAEAAEQDEEFVTPIAQAASTAVRKVFDTAEGEYDEKLIVPAAIEVALYLYDMLAEAGRAPDLDEGRLAVAQTAVAAVLMDYEVDVEGIDMDELTAHIPADQLQMAFSQLAMLNGA